MATRQSIRLYGWGAYYVGYMATSQNTWLAGQKTCLLQAKFFDTLVKSCRRARYSGKDITSMKFTSYITRMARLQLNCHFVISESDGRSCLALQAEWPSKSVKDLKELNLQETGLLAKAPSVPLVYAYNH